jgi:hypothetical protein
MFNGTKANPFVQAALDTLVDRDEGDCTLPELAAHLAVREPLLSPYNIECAAKEALRLALDHRKAVEAKAQAEAADDCGDASELAA